MLEIRFHGRGGQGAVVGSSILGMAFFYQGNYVQFFPEFGVERRGAPVQAFLRVSDSTMRAHYDIYEPDSIVLFDSTLLNAIDVTNGLKKNGIILINTKKKPAEFDFSNRFKVATIDADEISVKNNLGTKASPIINAAMAGAYAKSSNLLSIDSVIKSVKESVPFKIDENVNSAKVAYENVVMG